MSETNTGKKNVGEWNTGNENAGNGNTGRRNTGNYNTGNYNNGNYNVGNYNIGIENTGCCNTGDYNAGCNNTGNHNVGEWNTGNYNTGCFMTGEPKIWLFDKPSEWTFKDWLDSKAKFLLGRMPLSVEWVSPKNMTKEEKAAHPDFETRDGYLKKTNSSELRQDWWDKMTDKDKDTIKSIPNFDADIFEQCTGIKVSSKNYKKYPKHCIGTSDTACLLLSGMTDDGLKCDYLCFGEDGAYVVDENAKIDSCYKLIFSFTDWLKIFDDDKRVAALNGKVINIYKNNDDECIIQIIK